MVNVVLLTAVSYDGGGLGSQHSDPLRPASDPPRPTLRFLLALVLRLRTRPLLLLAAVVTSLEVEWKPLETLVMEA